LTLLGEFCKIRLGKQTQEDKKMTSNIELYEKDTVIRLFQSTLNWINQKCFGEKLSVTDSGDYVTVKTQGLFVANYDIQKLWDALENYDQDSCVKFDNLWDSLDNCKYTPQEDQKIDNELKTNNELSFNELSFSEKRQVALVDQLLGEDAITKTSISNEELWEKNRQLTKLIQNLEWENLELAQSIQEMHDFRQRELKEGSEIINHLTARVHELKQDKEYNEVWIENLKQRIHDLECTVSLLQKETNQITVLNESVTQLHTRIYQLEQENKQLKTNQPETKPEPKLDKKPMAKKPKFKLPENFADYQQECDGLIDALTCFYSIKKGKWNGNILQFILTPTDTEKAKHPYPDKWKAGLYLQPGQWKVDKVSLSDPDEWEDWFMNVNDFAGANDIEIS
jgi:myosin heavy subunit